MTRTVPLRPAAQRDLVCLTVFVAKFSFKAAMKRSDGLREALRTLGDSPYVGRPGPRSDLWELIVKLGRAQYVVRYKVSDEEVIVTRIWHSRERRS
jgi:plasmid stabilization system protein ParE